MENFKSLVVQVDADQYKEFRLKLLEDDKSISEWVREQIKLYLEEK